MNRTWTGCIFFTLGAAGGVLAARRFFEEKYARLAQEEIDSVKAAFARREKPAREEPADSGKEKTDYRSYAEALSYTEKAEEPPIELPPRVIAPDEFGEMDEYDQISLTYYADGTLTDEADRALDEREVEETIGRENLRHFGEYEPDSVFVRNDRLKADYEILLSRGSYAETLAAKPYLAH